MDEITMEKELRHGQSPAKSLRDEIHEASGVAKTPPELPPKGKISLSRPEAFGAFGQFLESFPMRKAIAIRRAVSELTGRQTDSDFFSLRNLLSDMDLRQVNNLFSPITGSIRIKEKEIEDASVNFRQFYTKDRVFIEDGDGELRGSNYFVALDRSIDPKRKSKIITSDMNEGLNLVNSIKRSDIKDKDSFLMYLGVIDYMKIHATTLFHALTFNERFGYSPDDVEYLNRRDEAIQLTKTMVRAYYQTLFGLPFDEEFQPDALLDKANSVMNYINQGIKPGLSTVKPHHFTYPEVNHPLSIALGANEIVHKSPQMGAIVGIPSGGTEASILTQLVYEKQTGKSPELILVPVSIHGVKSELHPSQLAKIIEVVNPEAEKTFAGADVLIVDDNASSGRTIQTIRDTVEAFSPNLIEQHVVEVDGREFLKMDDPGKYKHEDSWVYFNPLASPTTMDIGRMKRDDKLKKIRPEFYEIVGKRLEKIEKKSKKSD